MIGFGTGLNSAKFRLRSALTYLTIPSAPSFSSARTLYASGSTIPGYIFPVDIGSSTDLVLAGPWKASVGLNNLKGVKGKPIRLTNQDSNFFAGTVTATTHAFSDTNDCDYIEIYGKDALTPIPTYANQNNFSFTWNPINGVISSGSTIRIQNTTSYKADGGFLASGAVAGYKYRKLFQNFMRVDGLGTNTAIDTSEGSYNGHNGTGYNPIQSTSITHCAYFNAGREGWQIEHSQKIHVYNTTLFNVGIGAAGGAQSNLIQIHNSTGIVANSVFYKAPTIFNIFAHNVTIKNCLFIYSGAYGFIGASTTSYFSGSTNLTGKPLLFDGCYFLCDTTGTTAYMCQIAETGCNVEFRNCVFSNNITAIYLDVRAGSPSNSLIGTKTTNGNTSVPASQIPKPTFLSTGITDPSFGLLNASQWYNLGMGYRTPAVAGTKLNIIDALETNQTINVNYNTAFSGITGLTSTNTFYLEDGSRVNLPVTWTNGNYSRTGSGSTYTLLGVPTSGSTYLNLLGVKSEQDVVVGLPANPTKFIIMSFGSSTATYTPSGNYNHLFNTNPSGLIALKGNSTGQTLSSLRNTEGTLTGYNVNVDLIMSSNNTGQVPSPSGSGVFSDAAQTNLWYNPGSSGSSRGFFISGLSNSLVYKVEILASSASFLSGSQISSYSVNGVTGATISNFNTKGNQNTLLTWRAITPTLGKITVRVIKGTNQAPINAMRITYTP